jgi:hypothetical protein
MGVPIRVQKIPEPRGATAGGAIVVPLVPGAIEGVATTYVLQGEGSRRRLLREPGRSLVVFSFSGAGTVESSSARHSFSDLAAFVSRANVPVVLSATSRWLEYLEIRLERAEAEWEAIRDRSDFFVLYSECPTYGEAIKSASTTSRTIIPPDIVPRFCMGSVETRGPDEVGAHTHPILEQLFWGLPGNDCVVTADEEAAAFEERMLLHVPRGSRHGVSVHEGKRLHYLWMDFFRAAEDVAYIHQQHRPIGDTP